MKSKACPRRISLAVVVMLVAGIAGAETVPLSKLDLGKTRQGWGNPRTNKSVENHPLTLAGKVFESGLGTHADSVLYVDLQGGSQKFLASVGVDDETAGKGSVEFKLIGDERELWSSGVMKGGQPAQPVEADVRGIKTLLLVVTDADDGIDFDHADWADARFELVAGGARPVTMNAPAEEAILLTPPPPHTPRINGPRVFGARPGHPFLYTIPATGDGPMEFFADNLPAGLTLDAKTGRMTGKLDKRGEYPVVLRARNAAGKTQRAFRIVCGEKIALTPPLGWNSWNCFAGTVSADKIKAAADAMVASGLNKHGWTYINIDDCWEGKRDAAGNILTNSRFPDMIALCEHVHGLGLKIGIYSSPGPKTCAGFEGSHRHEEQDARRYAEWGFDYLKYDWCSYDHIAQNKSLPELKRPYEVMRAALDRAPRDIVFSLCQYGMGDVWKWGAEVGGNCWRTTGDITDTWSSMAGIGFNQAGHEKHAGPGHWNDPDMLVVGLVGWGNLHPSKLTPNEQYTHISLWCLLSAPLLIGCDMTQFDDFTLSLLTNDEVLDVNQDPLGRQAARVAKTGNLEVWAKDMEDGSKAVGLFNRGEYPAKITASWKDLDLTGNQRVRDLWRQQDIGQFQAAYTASVPRHGVVLMRMFPVP